MACGWLNLFRSSFKIISSSPSKFQSLIVSLIVDISSDKEQPSVPELSIVISVPHFQIRWQGTEASDISCSVTASGRKLAPVKRRQGRLNHSSSQQSTFLAAIIIGTRGAISSPKNLVMHAFMQGHQYLVFFPFRI
jgi:hypothetical protein